MSRKSEMINASAYHYQLAIQEPFKKICEPLFKLGIKYFCYYKIFLDGRYLSLINHPQYAQTYLSTIKNNGFTFSNKIRGINKNPYFLLPPNLNTFDKRKDPIMHLLYEFNIWNPFYIYKSAHNDFIECYGFAGDRQDTFLPNFYINKLELLEHFCVYFKEKAKDLIDCKDQRKLGFLSRNLTFIILLKKNA
jgi:hypothetical protein